jgi:hypothetical protein
MDGEDGA